MNHPLLIGITGGIGAGKTIVSKVFEVLSIPVYRADTEAKRLMNENTSVKTAIINEFGPKSYKESQLDNVYLAGKVFGNEVKLRKLNSIVHPAVADDFKTWSKIQSSHYVLKEAALLFETGSYKALDKIITVSCPEEIRISRVLQRDSHRSLEDVKKILSKQWREEEKLGLSDFEIKNDGMHSVIEKVLEIHQLLLDIHK